MPALTSLLAFVANVTVPFLPGSDCFHRPCPDTPHQARAPALATKRPVPCARPASACRPCTLWHHWQDVPTGLRPDSSQTGCLRSFVPAGLPGSPAQNLFPDHHAGWFRGLHNLEINRQWLVPVGLAKVAESPQSAAETYPAPGR